MVGHLIGRDGPLGTVIEVGCGQGGFGVRLASRATSYRAYEPDTASHVVARQRLRHLPHAHVFNNVLPDEADQPAELLCAFEVLEHLEDDQKVLALWSDWVRPGGRLLLSVPAHQSRFGPWDEAVGHYRRYERAELHEKLAKAGFTAATIVAYGFPLGYVLEVARNRLAPPVDDTCEVLTSKSGRLLQPSAMQGAITRVATAPFRMVQPRFARSEKGTGWVVLAQHTG